MLWTLFVLLLLGWMILVVVGVGGILIHLLLVIAAVIFVTRLLGKRP